jgi:hypothetical protein
LQRVDKRKTASWDLLVLFLLIPKVIAALLDRLIIFFLIRNEVMLGFFGRLGIFIADFLAWVMFRFQVLISNLMRLARE